MITLTDVPVNQLVKGDRVLAVDGTELPSTPTVLGSPIIHTRVGELTVWKVQITPVGGGQWWLYSDQHERVTVHRKVVEPDEDGVIHFDQEEFVVILDSLLVMAEHLEKEGKPSFNVRAAMAKLTYFSSPSTPVEIMCRAGIEIPTRT